MLLVNAGFRSIESFREHNKRFSPKKWRLCLESIKEETHYGNNIIKFPSKLSVSDNFRLLCDTPKQIEEAEKKLVVFDWSDAKKEKTRREFEAVLKEDYLSDAAKADIKERLAILNHAISGTELWHSRWDTQNQVFGRIVIDTKEIDFKDPGFYYDKVPYILDLQKDGKSRTLNQPDVVRVRKEFFESGYKNSVASSQDIFSEEVLQKWPTAKKDVEKIRREIHCNFKKIINFVSLLKIVGVECANMDFLYDFETNSINIFDVDFNKPGQEETIITKIEKIQAETKKAQQERFM